MTEPIEPLNPYAVTHSGATLSYPIHIGGKLTRDDLLMSLRDTPRKTGFARVQYPITAGIIIVAVYGAHFLRLDFLRAGGDEPILSVTWMIVAFTLLPGWVAVVPTLTRAYRRRLKRIEVMAGNQRDEFGWFDETHFVMCAGDSIFRARWNFFDRCLVFPTHILMPLVADATRRLVVPYRFFTSAEDARHACRFLQEKVGLLLDQPPSDADLADLVTDTDASRQLDVNLARQWNKDDWPFESDSEPQFDWAINLTADQTVPRIAFKAATAILFIMLYYFLPVWVATAAWLINDYLFFGDWGFIGDRPWSSILVLGPAGFLVVYFIYIAIRSIIRSRTIHAQGMDVRMRSAGIHLSHATFESWFPWSDTADVIVEEDRAGWIAKESMDEIQFTKICFESEDRFEEFKATLQRLRPES